VKQAQYSIGDGAYPTVKLRTQEETWQGEWRQHLPCKIRYLRGGDAGV
jgi:hypothetical protein